MCRKPNPKQRSIWRRKRDCSSAPWLRVPIRTPSVLDDEETALNLLVERGVAVQPGYFFDLPRETTLVLSLLTPEEVFRKGLDRIFDALAVWVNDS